MRDLESRSAQTQVVRSQLFRKSEISLDTGMLKQAKPQQMVSWNHTQSCANIIVAGRKTGICLEEQKKTKLFCAFQAKIMTADFKQSCRLQMNWVMTIIKML